MDIKKLLTSIGISNFTRVNLGRINLCFDGFLEDKKVFIKINPLKNAEDNISSEIKSLNYLKNNGFKVPEIISFGKNYIIMEHIEKNIQLDKPTKSILLIKELNKLHSIKNSSGHFGSDFNTFSGTNLVSNEWNNNWKDFFAKNRWKSLFDDILEKDKTFKNNWILCMKIYDIMNLIFDNKIEPTLLHGDMNPDNYIVDNDNNVNFIDPACFYGHDLYDICCLDCWNSKDNQTDPIKMLYYSYIYAISSQVGTKNKSYLKKSLKIMENILSIYINKAIFPTLLIINKNYDFANYDCILIQGGSYNPVHLNHINNIIIAHNYLENFNFKKILIVFKMASDERIKNKCKNGILLEHRLQMLKLAVDNLDLLKYNTCIDITLLWGDDIIRHYNNWNKNIPIYICSGSDTINYNLEHFTLLDKKYFIVIKRNGSDVLIENIKFLENNDEIDMSSRFIRSLGINNKKLVKYMHGNVLEYYNKQQMFIKN